MPGPRQGPTATEVSFADAAMHIVLADGRELSVPLEWLPRLRDASARERARRGNSLARD